MMIRCLTVLACLVGPGVIALGALVADDKGVFDNEDGAGCKAGIAPCGCRTHAKENWRGRYEFEETWKKSLTCWGDIAQFHCSKRLGKPTAEVMPLAFAQAKKENKLVLYFGNTGG